MTPFRTHPAARAETWAAAQHYRTVSPELGARFRAEFKVAINFIRRFPLASADLGGGVRHKLFRPPFPFTLWYTVEGDTLVVWAVGHQHREPGYWAGRRA